MSKLSVSIIETPDEFSSLTLKTGNAAGPTLVMSSANDKIFLNGTLQGLDFPEVRDAANVAYSAADTANASSATAIGAFNQANSAFAKANSAATTGKAIAMVIVFG